MAKTNWNYCQSIKKWYPKRGVASRELEVIVPPFLDYDIDDHAITLSDQEFSLHFRELKLDYFLKRNENLTKEKVVILRTKITGWTWEQFFKIAMKVD